MPCCGLYELMGQGAGGQGGRGQGVFHSGLQKRTFIFPRRLHQPSHSKLPCFIETKRPEPKACVAHTPSTVHQYVCIWRSVLNLSTWKRHSWIYCFDAVDGHCRGTQWPVVITKYYSGNQIENNEMGGACSTYGGKEIQDFGWETGGKATTWETQA
jgi:hypothetical protein